MLADISTHFKKNNADTRHLLTFGITNSKRNILESPIFLLISLNWDIIFYKIRIYYSVLTEIFLKEEPEKRTCVCADSEVLLDNRNEGVEKISQYWS